MTTDTTKNIDKAIRKHFKKKGSLHIWPSDYDKIMKKLDLGVHYRAFVVSRINLYVKELT